MKRSYSTLFKILGSVLIITLPYFIYRYFFAPQKVGINEVSPSSTIIDPQYIFLRKNNMKCYPEDCSQLWNMQNANLDLYPGILDIYSKIGTHGNNEGTRKIGIGVQLNYYLGDFAKLKESLRVLLSNSKAHSFPVYLSLNGFQWWDPNSAGFTSGDTNNVEWTCSSPTCAINTSWRNWGGGEFTLSPHPNIASRTFIDNNKQRLSELLPIIRDWYNSLPVNEKWLLGGIDLGTEVDIGSNFYYYPNGISDGSGVMGSVQLGYAAIKTLSLSGGITQANLNEVIRRYTNELNKLAYTSGIPRNKIFNHIGASDLSPNPLPQSIVFQNTDATVNEYGSPGWSFYGGVTRNLADFPGISSTLNKTGNSEWGSPEWLSWSSDGEKEGEEDNDDGWMQDLRGSLNYRNNRLINIANWEEIRDKEHVLKSIKTVANESPTCWVTAPQINIVKNTNNVTINWSKGTNNDSLYLNVSNSESLSVAGTPSNINIANENVTSTASHSLNNLTDGKYYISLIADGCTNQRRIVYSSFEIKPSPTKPGDLNGDGKVNIYDYSKLISGYGTLYSNTDFINILANYGK